MSPIDQPVIPKGSTVLVTAANGFLGSNIVDQFLKFGYKVRGTTRNLEKNAWMNKLFDAKYGPGKFELVLVPEMKADDAYDEAVKGTCPKDNPNPDFAVLANTPRRLFCSRPHGHQLHLQPRPYRSHTRLDPGRVERYASGRQGTYS